MHGYFLKEEPEKEIKLSDLLLKLNKKPELAFEVFDIAKEHLKQKEGQSGRSDHYILLASAVKKEPSLAPEILETIKETLKSEELKREDGSFSALLGLPDHSLSDYTNFLNSIYLSLTNVAVSEPKLASESLGLFKNVLITSDRTPPHSLYTAYKILGETMRRRPELASEVFDVFKVALNVKENNEYSLNGAQEILDSIAEDKPELLKEVNKLKIEVDIKKTKVHLNKNNTKNAPLPSSSKSISYATDTSTNSCRSNGR